MVNEAPCDVYLTGFILDPRFKDANIMRDLNPLAIQKIKIGGSSAQSSTADLPETLRRVGRYLLKLLRVEYEQQNFQIAKLSAPEAVDRCKEQVQKYIKGVYPFNVPFRENDTAVGWWTRLDNDKSNDPQPLAHLARNLLSVTPNSMADERTGSTFTWLNSAHRNRQEVATLVRLTQIRQWNMMNEDTDESPPFRPAVKFRDLEKTVRNMVATKGKQGAKQRPRGKWRGEWG
ncbi:hypothetical protein BD410DRAFT_482783 [Rickenella mellea]|uniref:HAT C-terminal dimerisation domain-containing protein n=1 Tax=Rickenella mellea TaxID=50990 RepID=A0A4Y7QIX0_9AGAM|nr:hypothetical protein BD410DRAFT_482783 [Rickenella mellea]